jgi:beta-glucosidase
LTSEADKVTTFAPDFLWGTATAAYQIEGSPQADGKGESIWDRFSHTPGKIENGDTGDVACDHYRRWPQDIDLMSDLGLNGYRFSISWLRILPQGHGQVNQPGLDFYDRLTDALLDVGITPFVSLYHWDLPQALQDQGGWANRNTTGYFSEYAQVVANRLGDRVHHWITHNEPFVSAFVGHLWGEHAPGIKDMRVAFEVSHNLLLSHGLAAQALKSMLPSTQVGITLNLGPVHPATASLEDQEAAPIQDGFHNRWFLDPIFKGHYPADVLSRLNSNAPTVHPEDMEIISTPVDFLGVNYYQRSVVRSDLSKPFLGTEHIRPEGSEYTEMGWEVYPDGLRELLVRLHNDYHPPALYVTENGAAFADKLDGNEIHDNRRIAFLEGHFEAARQAIEAGVPLKGYFVWSFMDNFEWAHGYSKRFGIVYVDYPTQRRILKDSGKWYREWIARERAGVAAR